MPSDLERYVSLLEELKQEPPPKLLIRAKGVRRFQNGESVESVAEALNLPKRYVLIWTQSIESEGLHGWLGKPQPTTDRLARACGGLAQMLVGTIAEEYFEDLSRNIVGGQGYRIEDERVGRTDTDYRLVAPDAHPICRFNIKFHGTAFAKAKEWVALEPEDCFALATYKIDAALKKQDAERLPFVFLIISVLNVPRAVVMDHISADWSWLAALSDRATEETIVKHLSQGSWVEPIRQEVRASIGANQRWRFVPRDGCRREPADSRRVRARAANARALSRHAESEAERPRYPRSPQRFMPGKGSRGLMRIASIAPLALNQPGKVLGRPIVGPPFRTIDQSITAMASISIRKPGSASVATPTQVEAGVASPEKNSRNAPPTAAALWASYATT